MTAFPSLFHKPARAFAVGFACVALLPAAALAQDAPASAPTPAPNPAVSPKPRGGDWMAHFHRILDRANQGDVDLIFDGDSITDGWQTAGKEVWEKNYSQLRAADDGISGDRTENVLWRLDNKQVEGLHPKLVALMIGTNNTGDCTSEQIAEGVTAIVHRYQELCPSAVILLEAIFPRGEKASDPLRAKIKAINAIIAKLDDGKKVIYVDFGEKFLQPDGTLPRDVMPDSLHPNAKGYEIWADAVRPIMEKVLGPAAG